MDSAVTLIPNGATITAVDFKGYCHGKSDVVDSYIAFVEATPADPTSLALADYDQCGVLAAPMRGATDVDVDAISTGSYLTVSFNATGIGGIQTAHDADDYFTLGIRGGVDVDDSGDGAFDNNNNNVVFRSSDYAGTGSDPYLEITYTSGGAVYQELNLAVSADAGAAKTDSQSMAETGKTAQASAASIESDIQQMGEPGKTVGAAGTVVCTDLKALIETGLTVTADGSASGNDSQQMIDTGKEVYAAAAVDESDIQQMADTGREVSAAASVSCSEIKVVFELNLTVNASGSVVRTDAHTMMETGKAVSVTASPSVIDIHAMSETGLGVSAEAEVSCTDTVPGAALAHLAAFMIIRQCTG